MIEQGTMNYDPRADAEKNALRTIAPDVICGCGNCANHARGIASKDKITVPDKTQAREILGLTPKPSLLPEAEAIVTSGALTNTDVERLLFLNWRIDENRIKAADPLKESVTLPEQATVYHSSSDVFAVSKPEQA